MTEVKWSLTPEAFDALLRAFDPDRERAALAHEALRERLIGLLRWWGSSDPEMLADVTFDRVARRIEGGAEFQPGSLGPFVRGVARLVFYESTRDAGPVELPAEIAAHDVGGDHEAALRCLDQCLDALEPDDRDLVLAYYSGERHIADRKRLAARRRLSMAALRIRTSRIRARLEACVAKCFRANDHPLRGL